MKNKDTLLYGTFAVVLASSAPVFGADSQAEIDAQRQNKQPRLHSQAQLNRPFADAQRIDKFLGMDVQNEAGEKIADIQDAVIDLESGRILYTLVSVQDKQGWAAVPPQLFNMTDDRRAYKAKFNKDMLQGAPTVSRDKENLGEVSFAAQTYKHFNQPAWWEGPNSANSADQFANVHKVSEIKGQKVQNVQGVDLGKIDNLILDLNAGRVIFLTVSTTGGAAKDAFVYAVPPNGLTMPTGKKFLVMDSDKERLASSPKFRRDNWPDLTHSNFAYDVYQHYGKQAYFEQVTPTSRPGAKSRVYPQDAHESEKRNN